MVYILIGVSMFVCVHVHVCTCACVCVYVCVFLSGVCVPGICVCALTRVPV